MDTMNWLEFQVTLAIRLSLQIYHNDKYERWASNWLSGKDRSRESAVDAAIAAAADSTTVTAVVAFSAAYAAYAAYTAADDADDAAADSAATVAAAAADSIKRSVKLGAKTEKEIKFL